MNTIYLDYNASTPVDTEVLQAMLPFLTENYGNPSSSHQYGKHARAAVENARLQVAKMLHCHSDEIIFTSGGTESNNMALVGAAMANRHRGRHIILSAVEHPAVTEVAKYLQQQGFEYTTAPVDQTGRVIVESLEAMVRPDTILISVMHANNETGTIQPVSEIAALAKKYHIVTHTDAAQSAGKIPVDVQSLGVDLLSIAGHKMYAPKGIGALYVKRGTRLEKYMHGAEHESNMRAGTENVPYIVALGKAADLINERLEQYAGHMLQMKLRIAQGLHQSCEGMRINGHPEHCLPNTLNISFKRTNASEILSKLQQLAVSGGAACHSADGRSGTLGAMHLPEEYAQGALRISTGRLTTAEEADKAVQIISEAIKIKRIRLTDYAHGMGCGCKMRPADLHYILHNYAQEQTAPVKVGIATKDDAAVYMIDGENAIVQTVDFFTPMINNPYAFGAIAAANAISDIYAMGAEPLFALNLVAFPVNELPLDILKEIMRGAGDKAAEAGIPVLGGHSIEDSGIKFGMVVTGKVHIKNLVTNDKAQPGDVLLLTKPLGTGILTKAIADGLVQEDTLHEVIETMSGLNKTAAEIMRKFDVRACTDITGFGLLGHLQQMLEASGAGAEIYYSGIPVLKDAEQLAARGIIPGGSKANLQFYGKFADMTALTDAQKALVSDAQTSGGLLICIARDRAADMINEMTAKGIQPAVIGKITERKQRGNLQDVNGDQSIHFYSD